MASKRFAINRADVEKVTRNAVIFLAPVLITLLTMAQQGVTDPQTYLYAFQVWFFGVALDFLRKFSAGKK
jgi:hypothetical protein